ncbi:MAG: tetraacyldisaccharide 4'-kinase [Candidatus Sumerlaeia bacterium]|nr:tetraacyldisaccharide 4'-kinase [Candidatus Sumerlaeia bacterium]
MPMNLEKYFKKISDDGQPTGPLDTLIQRTLAVVSPFYATGAVATRLLYSTGLRHQATLPVPVISVGNITLGGTGKSPFCLWLLEMLRGKGYKPGIVARGYGREDEDRLVLVHDGKRLRSNTREGGDEPVLLARSLGDVPVAACSDRHRAARLLIRKLGCDVIVLDDGFQHHRLARHGDIVLVDSTRPLSRLEVFPRGSLREPSGGLSRAHLIVLTRWNQATRQRQIVGEVQAKAPGVPVVRTQMVVKDVLRAQSGEAIPIDDMKGKRAIVLCGVGNPKSVRKTITELGVRVVRMKSFPDHATIPAGFLTACDALRRRAKADYIIITEKDAVKLMDGPSLPPEVITVRIKVEFLSEREESLAMRLVDARIRSSGRRHLLE